MDCLSNWNRGMKLFSSQLRGKPAIVKLIQEVKPGNIMNTKHKINSHNDSVSRVTFKDGY